MKQNPEKLFIADFEKWALQDGSKVAITNEFMRQVEEKGQVSSAIQKALYTFLKEKKKLRPKLNGPVFGDPSHDKKRDHKFKITMFMESYIAAGFTVTDAAEKAVEHFPRLDGTSRQNARYMKSVYYETRNCPDYQCIKMFLPEYETYCFEAIEQKRAEK